MKFAVFCYRATLMWRRKTASNYPPYYYCFCEAKLCLRKLILLLFSVNKLHCISLLPLATLKFAVFCCSVTLMWRRRTTSNYPPYHYCFCEAKLCLRKLILLLFSVEKLHCMPLLKEATLKFLVFWSSQKLTSLRGPGASALPPLTIVHSLSALQPWQHCTQSRHRLLQTRGCYIPAKHRRAAMTLVVKQPPVEGSIEYN